MTEVSPHMSGFLIQSGTELRHSPDAATDQGDHERKGDALTFGQISELHRTLLFALDAIWRVEIAICNLLRRIPPSHRPPQDEQRRNACKDAAP
jgi:hypothetical protein